MVFGVLSAIQAHATETSNQASQKRFIVHPPDAPSPQATDYIKMATNARGLAF
jgi:hypothetical protein